MNGFDDRHKESGNDASGKTVIIQIHSRINDADIQNDAGMEKTSQDADEEAILTGNRNDGCAEHEGEDNGRVRDSIAAGEGGQEGYTEHDRCDIPQGFSCGGETHNGKNTSDTGPV